MEALAFIAVAVVAGLIFWFAYQAKKKRRAALARFAGQNGLQYAEQDPFNLLGYGFQLFRLGEGRGCENVLWGDWQGLPVKVADYWYYTESTDSEGHRSRSYHHFSLALLDLEAVLPAVSVSKENVFTRLADHLGFRDIDFELEEFNRRFQVKSPDPQFAFKLIDARMIRWLVATDAKYGFEVNGSNVLVHCKRRKPSDLMPLLVTAKGFRDQIPGLVWNEYGAVPGPGPGGVQSGVRRADNERSPS